MAVIGSAELLVSPRIAPGFAADLRRQVATAAGQSSTGTGGTKGLPLNLTPTVDSTVAKKAIADVNTEFIAQSKKTTVAQARAQSQQNVNLAKSLRAQGELQATAEVQDQKRTQQNLDYRMKLIRNSQRLEEREKTAATKAQDAARRKAASEAAKAEAAQIRASRQTLGGVSSIAGGGGGGIGGLLGGIAGGVGEALVAGAALAAFFAIAKTGIGVILDLGHAFGDLEQSQKGVEAIFGASSQAVFDFTQNTSRNFLTSKAAANDAAVAFGNIFENAGATDAQAAQLATTMTGVAEALALVRHRDVSGVLQDMQRGIEGNARSFKNLGVDVSTTQVDLEAFRLGVTNTSGGLSESSAELIRAQLFLKGVQTQLKAAAAESGGFNATLQELSAAGVDAKAALGRELQPVLINIAVVGIAFARTIEKDAGAIVDFAKKIIGAVPVLGLLLNAIGHLSGGFNQELKSAREGIIDGIIADTKSAVDTLNSALAGSNVADLKTRLQAFQQLIPDQIALSQAQLGVKQSALGVKQAEQALAAVQLQRVRFTNQESEAHLGLRRALLGQQQANLSLQRVQIDTADILSGIDRTERQFDVTMRLAEATNALAQAQDDQLRAQLNLRKSSLDAFDAADRMVKATRAQRFNIRELLAAQLDAANVGLDQRQNVREAGMGPLRVQQAQIDLAKAQREASRFNTDQTLRERDAEFQLQGAQLAVEESALALITAKQKVDDLSLEGQKLALAEQGAQLAVDAAQLAVRSSADQLAVAYQKLHDDTALVTTGQSDINASMQEYISHLAPDMQSTMQGMLGTLIADAQAKERIAAAQNAINAGTAAFTGGGGGDFGGHGASGSWDSAPVQVAKTIFSGLTSFFADLAKDPGKLFGMQFGGPLPGIPGAAHGRKVRQESLIRIGEAGPEILAIRPGHRPEIIPNGGNIPGSGGRPINVQVNQVANDPEATAFAVGARLGSMVTA